MRRARDRSLLLLMSPRVEIESMRIFWGCRANRSALVGSAGGASRLSWAANHSVDCA